MASTIFNINININNSESYISLISIINDHLALIKESQYNIASFKKLIKDHLDPSCKDIDLDTTPIHLDEIDHELHPQIQEILTNNFVLRQKQLGTFEKINELLYKFVINFPNITASELQAHFYEKDIPLYLIPVIPSMTSKNINIDEPHQYKWGMEIKKYKIAIIITPLKKYLKESLEYYGFESLDEIKEYINDCGFISID